ncbi:MAG: hypothetical protein CR982_06185 [Candidatus Cloacimonadota bacterium]|nr:MAG: hypothetical protein CR982_06185 [Candidatus Cloacimonadota bacterium]PIE78109.1 MAG: hypothetical protein CSA15_09745 [Candidatus Delongbacteria bacterium]
MQDILSSIITKLRTYKKFTGSTYSVIVIDSGYFLIKEITLSLLKIDCRVEKLPLYNSINGDPSIKNSSGVNPNFVEDLLLKIYKHKPDFIVTVNMIGFDEEGRLSNLLNSINLPVVNWFTDTPFGIIKNPINFDKENIYSFSWEKHYIPKFNSLFKKHRIYYLPYATQMNKEYNFSHEFESEISFVGNSMIEAVNLWRERCKIKREVEERFIDTIYNTEQFSVIAKLIESFIDENSIENYEASFYYFLGSKILRERIFKFLDRENMPVDIYGDNYWEDYGFKNHRLKGKVNYYSELPYIYRSSYISLNITSPQMISAVNQRVFDCFSAGGFLISDKREDLEILFDSFPTYDSEKQLLDIISYYKKNIDFHLLLKERIKKSIRTLHSYENRLSYIIDVLRSEKS